jgi:hypothetical protein
MKPIDLAPETAEELLIAAVARDAGPDHVAIIVTSKLLADICRRIQALESGE